MDVNISIAPGTNVYEDNWYTGWLLGISTTSAQSASITMAGDFTPYQIVSEAKCLQFGN